jgi:hypothetical protein
MQKKWGSNHQTAQGIMRTSDREEEEAIHLNEKLGDLAPIATYNLLELRRRYPVRQTWLGEAPTKRDISDREEGKD